MKFRLLVAIIAITLNSALALHAGVVAIWWIGLILLSFAFARTFGGPWMTRGVYTAAAATFMGAVASVLLTDPTNLGIGFFLIELFSYAAASGWLAPRRSDAPDEPRQ